MNTKNPITRRSNFRVVVEPRRLGDYGWFRTSDSFGGISEEQIAQEYQERCEEILSGIKRHVDNVSRIYVDCDAETVCRHCGRTWEVSQDDSDADYPKGSPVCCGKAVEEYRAANSERKPANP